MRKIFLSLLIIAICSISAFADGYFLGEYNGTYLLYEIMSNTTVRVTYQLTGEPYNEGIYGTTTDVEIPSSITNEGITYSVTEIDGYAFANCTALTSITIPESITYIGWYAFKDCSSLATVNLNAVDINIRKSAWEGCSSFATLNIGEGVTHIHPKSFNYCSHLTTINYNAINCVIDYGCSVEDQEDYDGFDLEVYIPKDLWYGCTSLTTLNIGEGVTSISPRAFGSCSNLTNVNFNATNCSVMGSSDMPNYNTDGYVFSSSNANALINIGSNVKKIPDLAFVGLNGSGHLIIPNLVTYIGANAFAGCSGLTSVTIGNSVTEIGMYAFGGCGLTTVNFNATNCTSINWSAFNECSAFTTLNIGNNVTNIPQEAFMYKGSLVGTLTIPNSVTNIGERAFERCNFSSVIIGNGVNNIGESAFYECNGLSSMYYAGNIGSWCLVNFANEYANPLYYAHNLYINNALATDLLLNTTTGVKSYVFVGATCLRKVTFGASIAVIGYDAFRGCNNIDTIYSLAVNPPTIYSESGFLGHNTLPSNIPIIVPCGSVPAYRDSDWYSYSSNIQEDPGCQSTDVNDFEYASIELYPTPTSNILNITSPEEISSIEIVDVVGQVVCRKEVSAYNAVCDVEGLANGMYVIRIRLFDFVRGSYVVQKKFIKE